MCELNDVPECAENDAEFLVFVWPKSNIPGRHVLFPFTLSEQTSLAVSFEYFDIFWGGPFLDSKRHGPLISSPLCLLRHLKRFFQAEAIDPHLVIRSGNQYRRAGFAA